MRYRKQVVYPIRPDVHLCHACSGSRTLTVHTDSVIKTWDGKSIDVPQVTMMDCPVCDGRGRK